MRILWQDRVPRVCHGLDGDVTCTGPRWFRGSGATGSSGLRGLLLTFAVWLLSNQDR